ncbi:MAG: methylthioribulose 1-phosphate dehydratase [Planctomycetota bacterium]|jgi:methylthioribulose-1-phosphate dehydratase|nr:methylthioribulose 1-phosphate dehydratase [Planctomycetota bacterium]
MTGSASRPLLQRDVQSGDEAKQLICELGALFYTLGWVTGTGGGISIKCGDRIYMAPSGVQKEHITPDTIYELDLQGEVVAGPGPEFGLKVSECQPLFMAAYRLRGAGAVLHSHSVHAMLASLLFDQHFAVTHIEMLKGMAGAGYTDLHQVPIIENTPREHMLKDAITAAIESAPANTHAVMVRRHGVYVWGDTWIAAKRHAECYDYLFQAAVEMKKLGLDPSLPPG